MSYLARGDSCRNTPHDPDRDDAAEVAGRECLPAHDIVSELNAVRDRLDELEQLGRWGIDLRARVWRAERIFALHDADHDFEALKAEVSAYKQCCRVIRWGGR
jgi:hypothetical protein